MYVNVCAGLGLECLCSCVYLCVKYVCLDTHMFLFVCLFMCTCVCMCVCVCVCVCVLVVSIYVFRGCL